MCKNEAEKIELLVGFIRNNPRQWKDWKNKSLGKEISLWDAVKTKNWHAIIDELANGKRDEGLYYGIYNFAYKLGTSISLLASGLVLHVIGFKQGAPAQTDDVAFYLAMVPSYLLALTAPLVVLALSRYSIDRARHAAVRAQLDGK